MKRFFAIILCIQLCGYVLVRAQDMDTELSKLAVNLAAQIKEHGNKKVTVLDFTDLEGGSSELGKYIAEQLTVDLVLDRKDFSVLDRANLKKILDEHKLTAEGLIDPDTAKKVGMFAGVDAIILGTVAPKGQNATLTAKIITTDTAEIVGAGKAEFKEDATVQQFLSSPVKTNNVDSAAQEPPKRDFDASQISHNFGPLKVSLDSFRVLQNGQIAVVLLFKNTDTKNPIRVALNTLGIGNVEASLLDDQGHQYRLGENVEGIAIRSSVGYWYSPTDSAEQMQAAQDERAGKEMATATSIEPGDTVPATLYFSSPWSNSSQIGSVFRLQCGFTKALKGRYGRDNFEKQTLFIRDIRPNASQGQ